MPPKIYKSTYARIPLPTIDFLSYLFTPRHPTPIPDAHPIYIDAHTSETRTYSAVIDRTKRLSSALRSLDIQPQDIIAVFSPNTIDYGIICYAIIGCGATVSPVSAAATGVELEHQLQTSGARYLVVHSSLLAIASDAIKKCERLEMVIQADNSTVSSSMEKLHGRTALELSTNTPPTRSLIAVPAGEVTTRLAFLPFSSGTTSLPKGVMTTHFNIVSNLLQWQDQVPDQCVPGQNWIAFLPFSHIYGLHYMLLQPMLFGCTAVVMPRFDMLTFLKLVEKYKVETVSLVPPVVLGLVNAWDSLISRRTGKGGGYDLSSIKKMISAAAPLSAELIATMEGKFKVEYDSDMYVLQCWGLSETSPLLSTVPTGEEGKWLVKRMGSVGNLSPNLEMRVVDPESGIDIGWDAREGRSMAGELWIRGPNVCAGYYKNDEASKDGFSIDDHGNRWFRTGDIGTVDRDGFVTIVDRMKEMIKHLGFEVIPAELEGKLLEHQAVADACVFGVYVENLATEVPVGFIVLNQTVVGDRSREDVIAEVKVWLEDKTAGYKKLRGGLFEVESVPKSASGKILRRQLKVKWEKKVKELLAASSTAKL